MVEKIKKINFSWIRNFKNTLRKPNVVYLSPNNLGRYYIGVWIISLLMALGYGNNLILLFSFFIFISLCWWAISAHFLGKELKCDFIWVEDGFNRENQMIHHSFENIKEILFYDDNYFAYKSDDAQSIRLEKRGRYHIKKIKVLIEGGMNLYHSWKYFDVDFFIYTYPEKKIHGLNTLFVPSPNQYTDFDQIKPITELIMNNKIDWKRWSRNNQLVEIAQSREMIQPLIFERKNHLSELERSHQSYLLEKSYQLAIPWMIKRDGVTLGPFKSPQDYQKYMRELCI